ncbi:MAG: PIG-L family deacetylase [Actinomycetota bacterium]|nr:PIG-L family deacetylase [Actinomycetota bacterium]
MSDLTLMAVHAHPDDESASTGGILAKYARQGVRTIVVTCTNGEMGDATGGIKPADPGHNAAAVVEKRREELRAACEVLGVTHLEMLGYQDSGMMGWPQNDAPEAFWHTPVDEGAKRLAVLMEQYQPDVVVTYDEYGFYGHPDHIQANRITVAATDMTKIPKKLYYTTVPREALQQMFTMLKDLNIQEPGGEEFDPTDPPIGVPAEQVTTTVDVAEFVDAKRAALQAHASQTESSFFLQMPEDIFRFAFASESFTRERDVTGAPIPENDLFAGLR